VSTFDGSVILDEEPSSGGNISLNWTIEAFNPDKQVIVQFREGRENNDYSYRWKDYW